MEKKFYSILFILLVFHIGLVIPKTKFECSCHTLSPLNLFLLVVTAPIA